MLGKSFGAVIHHAIYRLSEVLRKLCLKRWNFFPHGSMPEKGEENKDVFLSTSLRRHDPDQVPGVEALSLLSADLHQLPQ
jgi:hypothetical protein